MEEINSGNKSKGRLYIVATPIGNLEDFTFRALRILKEVDFIACEDTRQTIKLLNKYDIKKRLISYYQPREQRRIPQIIQILKEGKDIALVSDSGTPALSDPGFRLVKEAIKEAIKIIPIPGASALTSALCASGLPTDKFLFIGFPPAKKEAAKKELIALKNEEATLIFYLPSRKMQFFLRLIEETLGNREVVIAREMTKLYEEFLRGKAKELVERLKNINLKGETTILIQGNK
jgi:16S rRNA (cytidine1402-2'-O)-methyltransferase